MGKSLFDLAVHAAWADRRLAAEELSAARAAARVFHPAGEEGARGRLLLGPELSLPRIARSMSGRESALGFALALWVVLADGVEKPCETALLDRFRLVAGLPRDIANSLRRAVRRARSSAGPHQMDAQLMTLLQEVRQAVGTA
ncbi:MAG: hypothetical protein R3F14_22955 [Polyangiaceae bacterium]